MELLNKLEKRIKSEICYHREEQRRLARRGAYIDAHNNRERIEGLEIALFELRRLRQEESDNGTIDQS